MTHRYKNTPHDEQAPQTGKVDNDHSKQGEQAPTQKNESRRTPKSRNDRENQIGHGHTKPLVGAPQGGNTHQPPASGRRG